MKHGLLKTLYFVCILVSAIYCFKRPLYNWDLLAYSAVVLKMDHHNPQEAFALSYKFAKENVPAKDYSLLTDSTNVYRYSLIKNEKLFNDQLPFYVVKPLYTALVYAAYKSHIPLPQATLVPSVICYLLIGVLLFYWLNMYLNMPVSGIVALLLMISSPLIEVAKLSTPDCLSAFLLLGSFYFILEKPSLKLALIFMVLSIFARLDNIIPCFILLTALYFHKRSGIKISRGVFLFGISLFIICYFLVGLISEQYGWSIFFYNDFADRLHPVYGSKENFSLHSYLRLMYEHVMSAINHSYLTIFMALLALNFYKKLPGKNMSFEGLFLLLIPVILFTRFILYPDISDRFYIAYYLIIIILSVKRNFSSFINWE